MLTQTLNLKDNVQLYWGDEPVGLLKKGENIFSPLAEMFNSEFINAGYKQDEVEAAARKVPAATQQISKPVSATAAEKFTAEPTIQTQQTATTTVAPTQAKSVSKKLIIILIISSALVLIGAAILGLF